MSASANEAVVRLAIDAIWNRGDLDVADELFSPGYVNVGSQLGDLIVRPGEHQTERGVLSPGLSGPSRHRGVAAANVDTVVVHWSASRGPPGPDGAITAQQRLLRGTTHSRLSDGRIVETRTDWAGT